MWILFKRHDAALWFLVHDTRILSVVGDPRAESFTVELLPVQDEPPTAVKVITIEVFHTFIEAAAKLNERVTEKPGEEPQN